MATRTHTPAPRARRSLLMLAGLCLALLASSLVVMRDHRPRGHAPPTSEPPPLLVDDGSPDASARARSPAWTLATTMAHPPYVVPNGVHNVTLHVGEGFDPTPPLHLVVFFHGASSCAEEIAKSGWLTCKEGGPLWWGEGHDARHDDAHTNTIFIVPQFAYFGGGSPGRMAERSYAKSFFDELLGQQLVPVLGEPRSLAHVASITLVSSSAGYMPAAAIVQRGELDEQVENVVLLDSIFSGDMSIWARWVNAKPGRKLVAIYNPWASQLANAQALFALTKRRKRVVMNPPGSLEAAIRDNDVVLAMRRHDHYYMSHMTLTKVLAGLNLPARDAEPVTVDEARTRPPATSLSIDADVDGVLGQDDARFTRGAVFDEFRLVLDPGAAAHVRLHGGTSRTECPGNPCPLDVALDVRDERGEPLAYDDDSAGDYDAAVTLSAEFPRVVLIRVTTSGSTYGSGYKSGPYHLEVRRAP